MNVEEEFLLYKGEGCHKCNNTGYIGRSILYEYININKGKKNLIKNILESHNEEIFFRK